VSLPPPDRAWSTWDHRFPSCVIHPASRFAVRVSMFSTTENRYEVFTAEAPESYELGEHTTNGDYVAVRLTAAGSILKVEFAKDGWARVVGRVRVEQPGEMIFRLNLLVEVGFLPPLDDVDRELELAPVPRFEAFRPPTGVRARWRGQFLNFTVAQTPILVGQYDRPESVAADLETRGWLHHPASEPAGRWAAFRFYGNPREAISFCVAQDSDERRAESAAASSLRSADSIIDAAAERAAEGDPAQRAIRDVMAWNTVWDRVNGRPYTCLSRGWIDSLGGWGVWLSDLLYNALLCARSGDAYMARENFRAVLSGQQAAGNLPCLVCEDEEWADRTQLPVAAFMLWRIYLLTQDRTLLEEAYGPLRRHLHWLVTARDGNGNGLYEYGTDPTGLAHSAHTKQAALNESGMDNLSVFDDASFDPEANTIELEEPGHNSLIALEHEMLARVADELGRHDEAADLRSFAEALAERISAELWDAEREVFAARHWSGEFEGHLAPTSFLPLIAGAATGQQAEAIVRYLTDEKEFWGELPLPSAPFSDPVNADDSYWRGRIWPPLSYLVVEGLRRSGRQQLAEQLAERTWRMFDAEWREKRHSHENFNSLDPGRHDVADSDPFYSWGALIPLMQVSESADVSPWEGLVLNGAEVLLELPGRRYATAARGEEMTVSANGIEAFAVAPVQRLTAVVIDDATVAFRVGQAPTAVRLPPDGRDRLIELVVDGAVVQASGEVDLDRLEGVKESFVASYRSSRAQPGM
jgi:putative isomerase